MLPELIYLEPLTARCTPLTPPPIQPLQYSILSLNLPFSYTKQSIIHISRDGRVRLFSFRSFMVREWPISFVFFFKSFKKSDFVLSQNSFFKKNYRFSFLWTIQIVCPWFSFFQKHVAHLYWIQDTAYWILKGYWIHDLI